MVISLPRHRLEVSNLFIACLREHSRQDTVNEGNFTLSRVAPGHFSNLLICKDVSTFCGEEKQTHPGYAPPPGDDTDNLEVILIKE